MVNKKFILFTTFLSLLLIIPSTSAQTTLLDNLIIYYEFGEGIGTTAQNSVSNNFSLNLINMDNTNWHPNGIINYFLNFNGVDEYAQHQNANLSLNSGVTVQAWVKPNGFNSQNPRIIYYASAAAGGSGIEFGTAGANNEQPSFCIRGITGANCVEAPQIPLNQWTHIVGTYNGNQNKIYVNGQLAGTSNANIITNNFTNTLVLGRHGHLNEQGRYWNGDMDEVGIWKRALNQNEISTLYNNGNGLSYLFFGTNIVPAPPVLLSVGPQTTIENQTLTIQLQAIDPNLGTNFTFLTNAQSVLPSPSFLNSTSGLFTWTPTFQNHGIYNVTFYVTDGTFFDSETVQIAVQDYSFATISMQGTPSPGNTITFQINNPEYPNANYVFSGSFGNSPGIPLPDGRIIPLNNDWLFNALLYLPQLFGFYNTIGTLSSQGHGTVTWQIPNIPGASGVTLHFSFITVEYNSQGQAIITSIAPAIPITLQ